MTRHSQRHRSTTLPFEYRDDGLDFTIDSYSVDGRKPRDIDLKPGQAEIDLSTILPESNSEGDGGWDFVTLFGNLTVPDETINAVFPEEERQSPPGKLHVAIRCHQTIYRDRKEISDSPTQPDLYSVRIRLEKDDVRGTVELRPYLVRDDDRTGGGKYASGNNFRVSSGQRYEIVVDRPSDDESPAIDGENVSFSQTAHLPDGEKLYYLDFRNEARPKLWINADHPRITDVLQSRGSVGAEARMRDVILDQISYGVWTQLLVRAGSAVDDEGDVEYEWQETVLKTFVRNLYDVDNLEEATQRFREDIRDPESLSHIVSRMDRELQEYINPREQLINLMEEGLQI